MANGDFHERTQCNVTSSRYPTNQHFLELRYCNCIFSTKRANDCSIYRRIRNIRNQVQELLFVVITNGTEMNEMTLCIRFAQHRGSANIRSCWKQASKQADSLYSAEPEQQTTDNTCTLLARQSTADDDTSTLHSSPAFLPPQPPTPQRIIKPNWSANPFNDATQLYSQSYWADDCVLGLIQ